MTSFKLLILLQYVFVRIVSQVDSPELAQQYMRNCVGLQ